MLVLYIYSRAHRYYTAFVIKLHIGNAFGPPRIAVGNHLHITHLPHLLEELLQILGRGLGRQLHAHDSATVTLLGRWLCIGRWPFRWGPQGNGPGGTAGPLLGVGVSSITSSLLHRFGTGWRHTRTIPRTRSGLPTTVPGSGTGPGSPTTLLGSGTRPKESIDSSQSVIPGHLTSCVPPAPATP